MQKLIISNIFNDDMNMSDNKSGFYKVADNPSKYAEMFSEICHEDKANGGSDYFTYTMKSISELWKNYNPLDIDGTIEKIQSNPCLNRWFSMILCIILFGKVANSEVRVSGLSFEGREYLRIWKNKFIHNGKDDNSVVGFSESDNRNSLNVYEFVKEDEHFFAGCYSKEYFIIPSKNVKAFSGNFEKFYSDVMKRGKDLLQKLPYFMKLKFFLSARSMPDDKPLKIIKDIINSCDNAFKGFPENIPSKDINGLKLYRVPGNFPVQIFSEDIYVTAVNGKNSALYPFTEKVADCMENGTVSAKITMNVIESKSMTGAEKNFDAVIVKGEITFMIDFMDNYNKTVLLPITFQIQRKYKAEHIKSADSLGTFCMYPDIPFEYENRCGKYTFFYNLCSTVKGRREAENSETEDIPSLLTLSGDRLCFNQVEKPLHLVKVALKDGLHSGYVLNFRTVSKSYPPLLVSGNTVEIDFSVKSVPVSENRMCVYLDFGSSSSIMGYKINNGILMTDSITGNTPVIRELLAQYDIESYRNYINLSSVTGKKGVVPSAVVRCNGYEIDGFFPYHLGFVPFINKFTDYESGKMQIDISHKSELFSGKIHDSTKAVIYNMCYVAVCHAINMNCKDVVILPSFPNEDYADIYSYLWEEVTDSIKTVFQDIEIHNLLQSKDRYLLYESIAVSNGIEGVGNNVLRISVDIGDSTTDISAVFKNQGTVKVCGYSSLNYGGKKLLKESFHIMLKSIAEKNKAADFMKYVKLFMLGDDGKNPFFISNGNDEEVSRIIDDICRKFYPNSTRRGRPRNESWQNNFMELLSKVSINTAKGEADPSRDYAGSADNKIKADIIMRYAVLMPVIKDFVLTALDMCDSDENTAINISFYGGGAKGILLADNFTSGDDSFLKKTSAYFKSCLKTECQVEVPLVNAKEQLLNGLAKLEPYIDNDGEYNISHFNNISFNAVWKEIDPANIYSFNEKREKKCKKFGLCRVNNQKQIEENYRQKKNPKNYISSEVCSEFKAYIGEIIDNFISDENISAFFKNTFVDSPLSETETSICNQLFSGKDGTSFIIAEESAIYPEMIRSTAYMFEISRLLSEHFGKGFYGRFVTEKPHRTYKYTH